MRMKYLDMFDRLGRPTLRAVQVVVLATIGFAIAAAFVRWSFFDWTPPELPGTSLVVAALPYIMQAWDHFTRSAERQVQIQMGQIPGVAMPNPHGGPNTP